MERVNFNGVFTDEIRMIFRKRREEYLISYHKLAALLNTSWLTVRNWEIGNRRKCHNSFIHKITLFLNGEMKLQASLISGKYRRKKLQSFNQPSQSAQRLLKRIRHTYGLCASSPQIQSQMIARILKQSKETLRLYIAAEMEPPEAK